MSEDLGRVGRDNLLSLVRHLRAELEQARAERDHAVDMARRQMVLEGCLTCRGGAEYKAMLANLTQCQKRCTELLLEARKLREQDRQHGRQESGSPEGRGEGG